MYIAVRRNLYNESMARGWESKSVESQQIDSAARGPKHIVETKGPDPAYLELLRKKETLLLSRKRVVRELEASRNPRYREMLGHALTDLDTQLSKLKGVGAQAAEAAAAS